MIPDREIIIYNSLIIDHNTYLINYNGVEYFIPVKEFLILSLLASKPGRIFSRDEIMDSVWKRDANHKTIAASISKIRKRFGDKFIKTLSYRGYGLDEVV
jgi:two-component system alkaline phosphatase synthesis response regulator PhoP